MLTEVYSGKQIRETIDFVMEECSNCHVPFFMTAQMNKRLRNNPGESFYCPNGHGMHYTGKTDAQKLKEELERVKKEKIEREEELQNKFLDEMNKNMKLEKQLKRVHNGVCPCCNRSFKNLNRHMKTRHPELLSVKPSIPASVVKINKK